MKISEHDKKMIEKIMQEEEEFDRATESVCENWWHCRSEQSRNGHTIDKFACKKNHAVDILMVRPYTMKELKVVLKNICDGANSEEMCSAYESKCDGEGNK